MLHSRSKAFRRGLKVGLSSPYSIFYFGRPSYKFRPVDLVSLSWTQVGKSLKAAISEESHLDGERAAGSRKSH